METRQYNRHALLEHPSRDLEGAHTWLSGVNTEISEVRKLRRHVSCGGGP